MVGAFALGPMVTTRLCVASALVLVDVLGPDTPKLLLSARGVPFSVYVSTGPCLPSESNLLDRGQGGMATALMH